MRSRVLYFWLCCAILDVVWLKPLQIEENGASESDETEYEVLNGASASNVPDRDENDIPMGDHDVSADQEPVVRTPADSSGTEYQSDAEQRRLRANTETFSDRNRSSEDSRKLCRQSNKQYDNNDLTEDVQYTNSRNANNYEVNSPQFLIQNEEPNKRTVELAARNDEDSMLFNRDEVSKFDNKYNNNEGLYTSERAHFYKQYNTMQTDNKRGYDQTYENEQLDRTHKRREARQTQNLSNVSNKHLQETDTLDEEIAIKNHIKKMSDSELKELLNSLTDEKKQLLKEIIDDTHANYDAYENINKREITKKAGALEENNLVENVQSELSKIQPSSSSADENTESPESTNVDRTTLSKQTNSPETENTNSDNKIEVSSASNLNQIKSDKLSSLTSATDTKNQDPNVQEPSKCENKREANYNDFLSDANSLDDVRFENNGLDNDNSPDSTFDQEYDCSQNEETSQLIDDKVENQKGDYKREAYSITLDDLPDSLKPLEESFQNSNAYSNSASYSGALVRVKRKDLNHNMEKRSAGMLPNAKTGYFQYRSESEEADNDEGNEFDDDGFYDITANLAKNKPIDGVSCDNSRQSATDGQNTLSSDSAILSSNNNIVRDPVNLGSDTDSVLSGIEGVDDNLMYRSNSRNRRNDDKKPIDEQSNASHSTQVVDNGIKTFSEIYMSAPNYQESDAFGSLPRNSDEDLGRYKRVRRLKPSHDSEEGSNSDRA